MLLKHVEAEQPTAPEKVVLNAELVVRASTASPRVP
jgi:DNA-binding LacI/PurR family transcriptional regulator